MNQEALLFAQIIIPLYLPQTYVWSVPIHLQQALKPGLRVEVSLRNKKYTGIVKNIFPEKPSGLEPKPILNILDNEPLLYKNQLLLWEWMAKYYMCTEGEIMQAALPANLKLSSETILVWNEDEAEEDLTHLSNEEYLVAEALQLKKELKLSEVQEILDSSHVYSIIKQLIEKRICYVWEELKEKYSEKKETYIKLHPNYYAEDKLAELLNQPTKAPKQMELLLSFLHLQKTLGEVTQKELLKKSKASAAQLHALIEKKILLREKKSVTRLTSLPKHIDIDFELTETQQAAADDIIAAFNEKNVCLLHGVTSSGKTHVYIKLIEYFIQQNKQVLYLLPEIALTTQIVKRLQKHFGGYLGVYHYRLNANEKVEIWNRVKAGEIKVILGARSSLLLPFAELGFIIVDEEHDASYKQQEPAPRYQARDTAIYYAELFHAKILLGSATPSLETYYNCTTGKYAFTKLTERFGNVQMPLIETVIVKPQQEIILSSQLKEAIESCLSANKQVILFQNRRGYAPYMICRVCGWIPQCSHCDVSLTLHKAKYKLMCHYCGTMYPVVQTCIACGSHDFVQKKFGTEHIEEMVAETFPQARVARMDLDTMKGKQAHEILIHQFEQHNIDILIGTQMVVKGLDFEHVSLVGILDADGLLHFADFRVNEKAFQLLEQVSGRAGRKKERGNVIIQISNEHHPVIEFVKNHDYETFFQVETEQRKRFFYPPFSRLIHLSFQHKKLEIAKEAAYNMWQALSPVYHSYMIGPAEPPVNRIKNKYLTELLLKLPKQAHFIEDCKENILKHIAQLQNNKKFKSVKIFPDVDPL
jgi:primosomal protein N' (replication factor Y)